MCIIAYYQPGVMPSEPTNLARLREGCVANPHGYGWAIVTYDPACPILMGHSMDAATAIAEFVAARDAHPEHAAMFHARITTAGTTSLDNCHPFWVGRKNKMTAVAHNGWLPCDPEIGDCRSDTRIFAEEIAARDFFHLDSPKTRARLERWMGNSKMVFLTVNPVYKCQSYIFNESAGVWDDDVWYSNDSYKPFWSSTKRSGYGRGYVTTYPVRDSWDDDEYEKWWTERDASRSRSSADRALSIVFLHDVCGQDSTNCQCVGGSRVFRAVDLLESDDPAHILCPSCGLFGMISEVTMHCYNCSVCFACDLPGDSCQCPPLEELDSQASAALEAVQGVADWRAEALSEVKAALALPAAPAERDV